MSKKKPIEPDTLPYEPVTFSTPVTCAGCEDAYHVGMRRECDRRFLCWTCYDELLAANRRAAQRPQPKAPGRIVPLLVPYLLLPTGSIVFDRINLSAWAGRPLTDDDLLRIVKAIPSTSIPQIIKTLAGRMEPPK